MRRATLISVPFIALALLIGAAVAGARTYEATGPGLKIRLVVRGDRIVATHVYARDHYRRGLEGESFVPSVTLQLRGGDEIIPIRAGGRFSFRMGDGRDRLIRLEGGSRAGAPPASSRAGKT